MSLEILIFAILGIFIGYLASRKLFAKDHLQILSAALLGMMLVVMDALAECDMITKIFMSFFVVSSYLIVILKIKGQCISKSLMLAYLISVILASVFLNQNLLQIIIIPIITTVLAYGFKFLGKTFSSGYIVDDEDIKFFAISGFILPVEFLPGLFLMIAVYSIVFAILLRIFKQTCLFSLSIPIVVAVYSVIIIPNAIKVVLFAGWS